VAYDAKDCKVRWSLENNIDGYSDRKGRRKLLLFTRETVSLKHHTVNLNLPGEWYWKNVICPRHETIKQHGERVLI
jgi:hypothetical protein